MYTGVLAADLLSTYIHSLGVALDLTVKVLRLSSIILQQNLETLRLLVLFHTPVCRMIS